MIWLAVLAPGAFVLLQGSRSVVLTLTRVGPGLEAAGAGVGGACWTGGQVRGCSLAEGGFGKFVLGRGWSSRKRVEINMSKSTWNQREALQLLPAAWRWQAVLRAPGMGAGFPGLCSLQVRGRSPETPGWPVAPETRRRSNRPPPEPWGNWPGPLRVSSRAVSLGRAQRGVPAAAAHLWWPPWGWTPPAGCSSPPAPWGRAAGRSSRSGCRPAAPASASSGSPAATAPPRSLQGEEPKRHALRKTETATHHTTLTKQRWRTAAPCRMCIRTNSARSGRLRILCFRKFSVWKQAGMSANV